MRQYLIFAIGKVIIVTGIFRTAALGISVSVPAPKRLKTFNFA